MKNKKNLQIQLRSITDNDSEFLYQVYRSTREEEMALTGWTEEEIEHFLRMQFKFQNASYFKDYHNATFDIILYNNIPVGRFYVDRGKNEIRIIDIALLPQYRRKGIGSQILKDLLEEAKQQQGLLSLHVEYNNPAMILYEKLGFEKKELVGVYYLMEHSTS